MLLKVSVLVLATLPGLARRRHLPAHGVALRAANDTVTPQQITIPVWPTDGPPRCDDITQAQIPDLALAATMCGLAERAPNWLQTAARNSWTPSPEFHFFQPQNEYDLETTPSGGKIHFTPQTHGADLWIATNGTAVGNAIKDAKCWWPAGFQYGMSQVPSYQGQAADHTSQYLTMLANRDGAYMTGANETEYYDVLSHSGETPIILWTNDDVKTLKKSYAYTVYGGWKDGKTMTVQLRDPYAKSSNYSLDDVVKDTKGVLYLYRFDELDNGIPARNTTADGDEDDCPCAKKRRDVLAL